MLFLRQGQAAGEDVVVKGCWAGWLGLAGERVQEQDWSEVGEGW